MGQPPADASQARKGTIPELRLGGLPASIILSTRGMAAVVKE